jgi:hypothetical protein
MREKAEDDPYFFLSFFFSFNSMSSIQLHLFNFKTLKHLMFYVEGVAQSYSGHV